MSNVLYIHSYLSPGRLTDTLQVGGVAGEVVRDGRLALAVLALEASVALSGGGAVTAGH